MKPINKGPTKGNNGKQSDPQEKAKKRCLQNSHACFNVKQIPFHDGLGELLPGAGRAAAAYYKTGGSVALRIRTTDTEMDAAKSVSLLERSGIDVVFPEPLKQGMAGVHQLQEEDISYPKICITLRKTAAGNYYEVSAQKVPLEFMDSAMDLVNKAGKALLEEKEMMQCPDESTRLLAEKLSGPENTVRSASNSMMNFIKHAAKIRYLSSSSDIPEETLEENLAAHEQFVAEQITRLPKGCLGQPAAVGKTVKDVLHTVLEIAKTDVLKRAVEEQLNR